MKILFVWFLLICAVLFFNYCLHPENKEWSEGADELTERLRDGKADRFY